MCRLYGYLSEQPTRVECGLVCAQNSMLAQSGGDRRGQPNPDGWGVAYFIDGAPRVERQVLSAAEDQRFLVAAEEICTPALVAHVRAATVGEVSIENLHPFAVGRWVFAHNGTVAAFDRIRHQLADDLPAWLAQERIGTTDSELCFVWLLARLEQSCPGATRTGAPPSLVAEVLSAGIRQILSWCGATGDREKASLNFVLSDGRMLLAARCGRTLYALERDALRACELCGTCHCPVCRAREEHPHGRQVTCRAFVVASEPITEENWLEVEEGVVLWTDESLEVRRVAI